MRKIAIIFLCCFMLTGCGDIEEDTYTLYRNSIAPDVTKKKQKVRIHYATFDSENGENYNRSNCEKTAKALQEIPGNPFGYWCEKGIFVQ